MSCARHFRDHGWLVRPPRELQERRQLVTDARSRLEQQLGHDPAVDEIADELELTTESVREAQVAASNLRPASLDATTADGSRPVLDLFDSNARGSSDPALDEGIVVRTALERLPARDQRIVELRFTNDLTQAEIAQSMGLSAMQVSRLLRRTLDTLRSDAGRRGHPLGLRSAGEVRLSRTSPVGLSWAAGHRPAAGSVRTSGSRRTGSPGPRPPARRRARASC